jgi:hypothetical protein
MEDKTTVSREELKQLVRDLMENELKELISQFDVLNGAIKQRHIDGAVIKRGLAVDLPSNGDASKVYGYFATDTNTLYLWNGTAWVSEVLT